MSLQVIKAGIQTLVQDYGRFGLQHLGITNSGPMDEHAFLWANKLLGNDFNAAQCEICMGGFEARFTKSTVIAICGADCLPSINNQAINNWQTTQVKAGDVLRLQHPKSGLYSYIAVRQGFQVTPQLDSCATVIREYLGGLHANGEKITKGDSLDYEAQNSPQSGIKRSVAPSEYSRDYPKQISVRFYPNQEDIEQSLLQKFTQHTFTVSQNINRMGYRLGSDHPLEHSISNRLSQGVCSGTIQLPQQGDPIVLMKDRQTIGGYPVLGCVAALDLAKLSQSQANTQVQFVEVKLDEFEDEYRDHLKFFDISF